MDPETIIIAGLVVAALGLWGATAQRGLGFRNAAAFAAAVGLLALVRAFGDPAGDMTSWVLFWIFATGAVGCGVLMITCRDPVHGALWFAVATLSVCGLFLQLSAPFLAAATMIVYAGAIIVIFMFVIMLAQQGGVTPYDQQARLPLPAVCVSFFLLGALAIDLSHWQAAERRAATAANLEQQPAAAVDAFQGVRSETAGKTIGVAPPADALRQVGALRVLGRTLFGEYLFAVELAGTLLLIATIGAIALAPRRTQGTL